MTGFDEHDLRREYKYSMMAFIINGYVLRRR
jgi:hypothetical protein